MPTIMERLQVLKAYLDEFQKEDRRSINNSVYIGQEILGLPKNYQDFEGFGKLGVSSLTLHLDYSFLKENHQKFSESNLQLGGVRNIGEILSKYPSDDLRILSFSIWYNGKNLREDEEKRANVLRNELLRRVT